MNIKYTLALIGLFFIKIGTSNAMENSAKRSLRLGVEEQMIKALNTDSVDDLSELLDENPGLLEVKLLPSHHNATPLLLAGALNAVKAGSFLLQKGASRNAENKFGITVMGLAAANNSVDFLQLLLENGFSIDQKDATEATPLQKAIATDAREATDFLLQHGAQQGPFRLKVDDEQMTFPQDFPLLHFAVLKGAQRVTQLLLDQYNYKKNVNDKMVYKVTNDGAQSLITLLFTPNDLAVMGAHHAIAHTLKEHGADATSHWNHMPFVLAAVKQSD